MADAPQLTRPGNIIMNTPKIDLIVTRHPALLELLIERGIATSGTPVMVHAEAEDVFGQHVAGILPMWLADQAASVTELRIDMKPCDRGVELTIERLREISGSAVTYYATAMKTDVRPRWLAAAAAYKWVDDHGQHFGAGPGQYTTMGSTWCGLPVALIGDGAQQCSAHLIESRGVWRPSARGPWLDGFGNRVSDGDIAPASGWTAE